MRKKLLMSFVFVLALVFSVVAQDRTVTGKVTSSEDGSPLPGVSVSVKGSTKGTVTSADGSYKISISGSPTLIFSFVGFKRSDVTVGTRTAVDVTLSSDASELSEVVVTANGIERDKRSLSYATQEVKGDLIAQKGEPNVLNALQGKVAGVQIVGASGEPGASTNINIRGIQSFTGNNQPLFVVDGVPISNDLDRLNVGSLGSLGGPQSSNRAVDINPDNIESVNVLKGPAASALYGSRAASGVVIITTKSGKNSKKKTEITFNSSLTLQDVYGLPTFQNEYGQGGSWVYNPQSSSSWGPSFETVQRTGYSLSNGLLIRNATTPTRIDTAINANNGYRLYENNILKTQ
jgi:TonB-dependent SusC/RagA subfamily outer membrane receptor